MATIFRVGIYKLAKTNSCNKLLSNKYDLNIRGIASRTLRNSLPKPVKPAPWPYKEKGYTYLQYLYDKTTSRLDENSKIVVVEGPVASWKTKFAKELACELEMLHLPEANQDMFYTNDYGYDLKQLDSQMPVSCRSHDVKDFLCNPRHQNTALFQIWQYMVKYSQYIDALAHVLSTGQGVVLERSPYSDYVFLEAMYKQKYITPEAYKVYYEIRKNTISELLRPHLVIYLDVPVPKVLDNIKKRHYTCEMNSSVLNADYLQAIEDKYKRHYLKDISSHAHLLIYDWSEQGDVEVVVEDIERINFVRQGREDPKSKDWNFDREDEWAIERNKFADKKHHIMNYFNVPIFDAPELLVDPLDKKAYLEIVAEAPGMKYYYGYNPSMGDSVYFKIATINRETLPAIERKFP